MPVPRTQRSKWLSSCTQSLTGSTTAKRRHVTPHTRDQTEATDLRDPAKKDCAMFAWSVVTEMRYETCWNTPAISYACMCARMHARAHLKARHSARGLNVWKRIQQQVTMACQESAGGILPCLSEHAEPEVSGSHSFTPPFLLPRWKDSTEWKERGERNLGGSRTRDEVCGATREGQTV